MKRLKQLCKPLFAASIATLIFVGGCAHYRITDTTTGTKYYTTSYHRASDGTVQFKDKRTDLNMTVQSPDITKVDAKEYKTAVKPIKTE